jgi:hypothetical protein
MAIAVWKALRICLQTRDFSVRNRMKFHKDKEKKIIPSIPHDQVFRLVQLLEVTFGKPEDVVIIKINVFLLLGELPPHSIQVILPNLQRTRVIQPRIVQTEVNAGHEGSVDLAHSVCREKENALHVYDDQSNPASNVSKTYTVILQSSQEDCRIVSIEGHSWRALLTGDNCVVLDINFTACAEEDAAETMVSD